MTLSRWQAQGNIYLVAETDEYTMDPELDGVMQILEVDGDDVTVAIVNPDGSLAEMSGNGTRIAVAGLLDCIARLAVAIAWLCFGHSPALDRIGVRFRIAPAAGVPFTTCASVAQLACRNSGRKSPLASWTENNVLALWFSQASHHRYPCWPEPLGE